MRGSMPVNIPNTWNHLDPFKVPQKKCNRMNKSRLKTRILVLEGSKDEQLRSVLTLAMLTLCYLISIDDVLYSMFNSTSFLQYVVSFLLICFTSSKRQSTTWIGLRTWFWFSVLLASDKDAVEEKLSKAETIFGDVSSTYGDFYLKAS